MSGPGGGEEIRGFTGFTVSMQLRSNEVRPPRGLSDPEVAELIWPLLKGGAGNAAMVERVSAALRLDPAGARQRAFGVIEELAEQGRLAEF